MIFFEYILENTVFHRMHPLTKLTYVSVTIIFAWLNIWSTLIILITSIFSFYIGKAWKQNSGIIKTIIISFMLLFSINWFLYSIAYPSKIWVVDRFLSLEGLYLSSLLSSRILIIILNIILFFATTTPEELEDFLLSLHLPASLIISFTLTITFIPLVVNETKRIYQAQLLRGLAKSKLIKKISGYVNSLIFPLIISILNRANRVAEVLEIYGVPPENRTILTKLKFRKTDYLFTLFFISLCFISHVLGEILMPHLIELLPFV